MLSLKIRTRIGTDGAGAFCGGHSNAVGLRLYFDAVSRPSRFDATLSQNSAPVANAGQDQQVRVGDLVTLDGRDSYDPDGDLITYNWTITSAPSGSIASLTNPTSVMPTFVPDRPGNYVVLLTVNDGQENSSPDDVIVIAAQPNVAPTAIAGPDQSVVTGSQVFLDGRGSFDPDGDSLTYQWQMISLPDGSTASFDNPSSPTPTFVADQNGQYVVVLTVNDGELDSLPDDVVVVSATPNAPPVAFAGDDQTVPRNSMISLNASGSYDPENSPLTYIWSIVSSPQGSTSQLDDPTSPTPTIPADKEGDYVFRLVVYDGQLYSDPDTVVVRSVNAAPIADAGPDKTGMVGVSVILDGSGSSDQNGDPLTYQWSIISAPSGSVATISNPASVITTLTPDLPGTYTIQLVVNDGWVNSPPDSLTIAVIQPNRSPVANPGGPYTGVVGVPVQFDGSGSSDPDGDPITFSWDFGDGATGSGATPVHTYSSPGQYTITLTVQDGKGGSGSAQTTANINNPNPSLSSINPSAIIAGSPEFTLTLNGDNFLTTSIVSFNNQQYPATYLSKTQIEATIPSSAIANPGSFPVKVINPGPGGGKTSSLTFRVDPSTPPVEPQPEGSFGEQYQDLIPPDVTVPSYDPKRFSVITGLVKNLAGSPIPDVSVNILGRLDYGTAKTDAEGRFSIPVEGGGTLTATYKTDGLITTHRKVYVPWNDIAIAETIEMIPEDTKATTFTFDGNPSTVLAHQGTIVTDDRGSRSSTVVLTGDNRAYSIDAQGNVIQELTTITARATEFATENSMPAKLPPNSAYTYCVELSVDGAARVRFDNPVIFWVDNFLGFNVGEAVPVGYYDRDRGVWVPSDNGKVVRLLDTNNDGIVDALDSNGDGQPDDLNGNGSFSDEVAGLTDPHRYPPNSTFWRVAVTHFTPWDLNWPFGPPADAIPPNPQGVPDADQQQEEVKVCKFPASSFIDERSRIFHEDIPIPGTAMTLHYASNRVKGFQQAVAVPASGNTVPSSLKRIIVQLNIAGRSFGQIFNPLPNQEAVFIWDGLNHLGSPVKGPTIAYVSIGFVYDAVYLSAGNFAQAFAQAGSQATGIPARQEVISWKSSALHFSGRVSPIAEGWTLSPHHHLSPVDPSTLHKGDGSIIMNNASIIETVVSDQFPWGIAVDASGNIYFTEYWYNQVWKADVNGSISPVAGSAGLNNPFEVEVNSSGNLYIADAGRSRILKVDPSGVITTVAGSGIQGYGGDGGPATSAKLNWPWGVAIDNSGNLYIADGDNNRVRKVDPNGIITTVAGTGVRGFSGDGGPATQARFYMPSGIAVDVSGNLYISDTWNARIRKVDTRGIITTIAGNGNWGYSGDGGPATQAMISYSQGIVADGSGAIYFADVDNYRIRRVSPDGIITTVAGNGEGTYFGDGGPATAASLYQPAGVALDGAGNLYIADTYNRRIRKVGPNSTFAEVLATEGITFSDESGLGYVMSSSGQHKTTVDLDTQRTLYTFGYDENNNIISVNDQFGNQTTIQRDASGVPISITSPDGLTTTLVIDSNNHLTKITYPDTGFYSFEYNPDGLMTAKIEPEGNRFEHTFNSSGRLTDVSDQEGGHWQYSRSTQANGDIQTEVLSAEGNLTSYLDHTDSTGAYTSRITDPSGAQTLYSRSTDGFTATKSLPCGMNFTFKYDVDSQYKYNFVKEMREKTSSNLEKVTLLEKTYQDTNADTIPDLITEKTTLNGKLTTLVNNTLQSNKTLTSPVGRTTTTFYDPNNLLTTKVSIPGLHDTNFGYDTRGRLTSINTDIRQTTFAYDSQGNLNSVTDPENRTTTYSYDAVGRMTGIHRPDTSSLSFTYDKNGNMTVLANAASINHGFSYNKVDLNSSYQAPLSGSYGYLYNKDRRLLQVNFPSGKQIRNIYDKDRIIQAQTPEGNIDLTYLCGTKVGSITKGTEIITYGYDGSLVTSENLAGTLNQVLNYAYNSDFSLRQLTYAGGSVNYTYDNDGLLTGAGVFTITRNTGNGLPGVVTGGALNLSRTFNGYGELETQTFAVNGLNLTSWTLARDNTGRITSKTETVEGATSNYVYTYDSMGRLLMVTKDGTLAEEYQYDSVGRRTYEMNALKGISGRTFDYSDEDHLLTAGDVTYQYDLDGFLRTKTVGTDTTMYNYSSRGELLRVDLPDGRVIEYINDPLGRRVAKKVDGIVTEKYLWQGLTRLLAMYDGSNNLVMRFEYADARMPAAMTKAGVVYYLTYDQVGSLRAIADASGNVVKRIDYDSFGSIISDTNPLFTFLLGFAGGLYDPDTELVRFGFRDYDPVTGRWSAKDPIMLAGGDADLYGYVQNNPVNFIDPLGLKCKKGFWERSWENFKTTNEVIPGILAPPLMGFLTSGKMAQALGSITLRQWASMGFRGAVLAGAGFTALETGVVVAGTAAVNFAYVALAWETGVAIGSMISAAILPCEEEPSPACR